MILHMKDILNFGTFYEAVRTQKLSMKTAYRLAQLARAIEEEMQFYRDKLQMIVQEYGEIDESGRLVPTEDGTGIKLRPGTEAQCYSAMYELQAVEVTLPDIKFTIDDFGNAKLSAIEMDAIIPFIEE